MATVKSHTDLEQSKKLAKILPLESADMHYIVMGGDEDPHIMVGLGKYIGILPTVPCWSLAALLELLEFPTLESDSIDKGKTGWMVTHYDDGMRYDTKYYNNPVDACVAMIEKLHEQKLL